MNRMDRRRQAKSDSKLLSRGIDPTTNSPQPTAAMARLIFSLIETAKRTSNISPAIEFLYGRIDATLRGLADVPVACKRGCSHCCYIWVSATAPEILHIAKQIRPRGAEVVAKVIATNGLTKDFEFDVRDQHPTPCPLLVEDACSIYPHRPKSCRLASSADAEICARSYRNLTDEGIPTPVVYLLARTCYSTAFACALRHAGLPTRAYEFNAGLARALELDEPERAWLSGEDIFADVRRDPADIF